MPTDAAGTTWRAVCDAMGQWGARWLEIEPHHLDPAYVLWATLNLVDVDALPDRPIIVRFDLRIDVGTVTGWCCASRGQSCAPVAVGTSRT